jgi:alpha-galactosidase
MAKICFLGAGSTIFAKEVLGDCLLMDCFRDAVITLVDIDADRLHVSEMMLHNINETVGAKAVISSYLAQDARQALAGADYVFNAIQVGGYEPATVIDFEIPKKYGLRQTIGDTLGIGGIFRALRTIPVTIDYCRQMEEVCPDALLVNLANPMGMLVGAISRTTAINTVGLCHSVPACAPCLCKQLDLPDKELRWVTAGINHQGWLLKISQNGTDLYPEIKRRAQLPEYAYKDAVRFEIMKRFGYYVTESSEHSAEYVPWFIKSRAPELIERFRIPLDEYPRRCLAQIEEWEELKRNLLHGTPVVHESGLQPSPYVVQAIETGVPFVFGGNVLNKHLITNLPNDACVEVMCVADRMGITPTHLGDLPPQCAALTRTNVNVQLLAIEAALTQKKEHVYHAALLDPHTSSELTLDETVALCDDLLEAHALTSYG